MVLLFAQWCLEQTAQTISLHDWNHLLEYCSEYSLLFWCKCWLISFFYLFSSVVWLWVKCHQLDVKPLIGCCFLWLLLLDVSSGVIPFSLKNYSSSSCWPSSLSLLTFIMEYVLYVKWLITLILRYFLSRERLQIIRRMIDTNFWKNEQQMEEMNN